MSLVEYLYVDERRLQSYVDQIGPPVAYDKTPSWTAELSVLGPKATATQEQRSRPLTTHEKVCRLLKHMTDAAIVSNSRLRLTLLC